MKVTISNYTEGKVEEVDAVNNPEDEHAGTRKISFSKTIFIDRNDFMEDPPKKYFRMAVGKEVRLKYAYYVTCKEVIKDENDEVIELICDYDPESRGGGTPDERKVKGTIQWVDSTTAINPQVKLYDRLFSVANPEEVGVGQDYLSNINPDSLELLKGCLVEKSVAELAPDNPFNWRESDTSAWIPKLNRMVN